MNVIGIDIGTSGTKSVLFNETGKIIASSLAEYPLYQPQSGMAEQDAGDWREAVFKTVSDIMAKSGVSPDSIGGIGLSGQMHGLVMLDRDGSPLRRSIIWCDQRTSEECSDIENAIGHDRLIEITANPALTGFTASKIMWVKKHEPEIYEKCCHILLPKDYIRYCLTGEFATEVSDASGMQLLDVPGRCWSDEVLSRLEIDKSLLGSVYESPEISGRLSQKAAQQCGLRAGIPVVGGAGDNAAAAVGTGVVTEGSAFTTIGTSGVVFLHSDEIKIDPLGRVHTFCCAVPGAWHVMGVTQGAGLSLKWLRDTFLNEEKTEAESKGVDPYYIMDKLAEQSPIGANKLLFLPYLMGERTPHLDPFCRGVFFGISAIHTKKDFIRSVMEGVSFSLADCLSVFGEMGLSAEKMTACGGGGSSPLWRGMLADIYGCQVNQSPSKEAPALGAAILAMAGIGLYKSVSEACGAIINDGNKTDSDKLRHEEYMKYYKIYRALYPSLKQSYRDLAEI